MGNFSIIVHSKESLIKNLDKHVLESSKIRFLIFDWELSSYSHLLVKKNKDKFILSYTLPFFFNVFNRFVKKSLFNFQLEIKNISEEGTTKVLGVIKLKTYIIASIIALFLFSLFQVLAPYFFEKALYPEINWNAIAELSVVILIVSIFLLREYFLFKKRMKELLLDIERHYKQI